MPRPHQAPPVPHCPACELPLRFDRVARGFRVLRCAGCGYRGLADPPGAGHARAHFGDAYFTAGGAGYADYLGGGELVRRGGHFYAAKLARWVAPGRAFDAGAAAGFTLAGLRDRGWAGAGVEPNAGMAARARAAGFAVRDGTLEALDPADCGPPFDAVTLVQVVAHLADPLAAARNAARLLRPGGVALAETWNPASVAARAAGAAWHEWSPPTVRHWFPPRSLGRLLRRAGLVPVAVGFRIKWLAAAHARDLLAHALYPALARLPAPDLALPYPADDLYWLAARKPASPRR